MQMYGSKITRARRCARERRCTCTCQGRIAECGTNRRSSPSKEIILCEALIDALTFWCAGYRPCDGELRREWLYRRSTAFQKHGTKRIYIAYDRDDAGERAAQKLAEELMAMGIECFRVQFPKDMDANEFALKVTPATKSLGMLLQSGMARQRPTAHRGGDGERTAKQTKKNQKQQLKKKSPNPSQQPLLVLPNQKKKSPRPSRPTRTKKAIFL